MKRASEQNINTKFYWDSIYTNDNELYSYEADELTHPMNVDGKFIYPSRRFTTALNMIKEGEKLLDIGCGTGNLVKKVLDKYPFNEAWGVDISSAVIEVDKNRIPDGIFIQQTIGKLDKVPNNYFDVVFSGEVMEHLEDPGMLFRDAYNALKPGGRFIVTTPNDKAVKSQEHIWFITDEDVKKYYEDNGFTNVQFVQLPEIEKILIIFAIGEKRA